MFCGLVFVYRDKDLFLGVGRCPVKGGTRMSWNYVEGVPLFGTYGTYKRAFVGFVGCW